ncbi:DNA cytosine methyltransferase [Candidatus Woesearchaeota archaeon]|nr:DNA cytosine methyltransferase [Candidatus Woesearchaeota archaeon]
MNDTQTFRKLNVVDFFCGAGGFSKGFEQAGFNILAGIDFNENAIATFKQNHSGKGVVRDIKKLSLKEFNELTGCSGVDVLIGGFPCQGFSLLGKRNKKDPRNLLYRELLRFIEGLKPEFVILENVRGLASMKDSKNNSVLSSILQEIISLGYCVSYKVLLASDYGVPQNRERLIIFAQKINFFDIPKIENKTTVIEALQNIPEGLNAHIVVNHKPEYSERLAQVAQGKSLGKFRSCMRLQADKPSNTITSGDLIHPTLNRFLTPRESARLQGFSDDFVFCGGRESIKLQIGNAVPPLLAKVLANQLLAEINRGVSNV